MMRPGKAAAKLLVAHYLSMNTAAWQPAPTAPQRAKSLSNSQRSKATFSRLPVLTDL
jgi:hypothetical protein